MSDDLHTLRSADRGLSLASLTVELTRGVGAGASVTARSDVLSVGSASDNDLVLQDRAVSRYHLSLRRTEGGIEVSDLESTNGTFCQGLRLQRALVPAGTLLELGDCQLRVGDGGQVAVELHEQERLGPMFGRSPIMRRVMAQVTRAAASDASVLISGESGTGKEVVARSLHALSPRAQRPLEIVDCGALIPTLVASELFGHERGAFTGADRQHIGAFERADGGTLFLDEIGELPPALQATLLGVLERRRFRRLGGRADIHVDVRIVSASHRDLRKEVNQGSFRLDLFYRLAVIRLALPPLRERREDIPLLAAHFVAEAGCQGPLSSWISEAAMQQLIQHRFPGNVRELRNLIEATIALGEPPLESLHETADSTAHGFEGLLDLPYKLARGQLLGRFERSYLEHWFDKAQGNVSKLSRDAQIDRSHLNDLLRRHGLR